MDSKKFIKMAKQIVLEYVAQHKDPTDEMGIGTEDVYVVWLCKALQNNKALISTTLCDGMYYEVTYNGDKNEFYLDVYKKWENVCIEPVGI